MCKASQVAGSGLSLLFLQLILEAISKEPGLI